MKRPFVFFPAIDYQSLYQRPQHLASNLVKKGYDVYFRNVGQVCGREPIIIEGVHVYQDWDKHPLEIDSDAIYVLNYPSFSGYRNWAEKEFMIFDCVDDFPDFKPYMQHVCDNAHLITYTTDKLRNDLETITNNQMFKLPNGVGSNFCCDDIVANEMFQLKRNFTHIIGFVGAMHFSWTDIELLYQIANKFPSFAVVIIGDTYCWDFSNRPFNLMVYGRKEYSELASYYKGFDVGIIPFLDNQIGQGADPIKLYEYASCGIPVVSKDLSFVQNINEPICYKYNTYNECFAQIINAINSNNDDSISQRKCFASENTWEKRVNDLLDKLDEITYLEV